MGAACSMQTARTRTPTRQAHPPTTQPTHPPRRPPASIYRGDWLQGRMHGCGVKLWRRADGTMGSQEGKFFADDYVGPVMPCSKEGVFEAAVDADVAAYQARSFQVGGGWVWFADAGAGMCICVEGEGGGVFQLAICLTPCPPSSN